MVGRIGFAYPSRRNTGQKRQRRGPQWPRAAARVVDVHIETANNKVKANNDTLHNLDTRKKELSAQIWRRLLEDTKATYDKYKKSSGDLDAAINGLGTQIEQRQGELKSKNADIEENERKITSIKPTIDAINKLLKSFGFANFYLVESAENGFYEVKRPGGEDAKDTLSEGEKSFITFLYFYRLIGGSFSASGATTDRIVVFDDPVSSLDADFLFIVCNLIKGIVNEMREGSSAIKQVFVLIHNIYFHKGLRLIRSVAGPMRFRMKLSGSFVNLPTARSWCHLLETRSEPELIHRRGEEPVASALNALTIVEDYST